VAHLNYTITKWVGEQGCNEQDLIVRPRLLFGDFMDRNNLLCKLTSFTHFVAKQNSYTSLNVLVDAIIRLLKHEQHGVFNVACDEYASVVEIAKWVGLSGKPINGLQLRRREGIHLINNIMDISKLKAFYKPPALKDEIMRCWEAMK
jgi:nucleoside-diphosphate-sugar epimerase